MRKKSGALNGTSLLKLDSLIAVLQVHPVIIMFWPKQFLVVVQFGLASEVVLLQLLFGSPLEIALVGGLRMLVMTMAFLCMLAATRIQDIAQALVTKFHLPCEYAFMLTTALRFVPNFLADSTITLDAQSCRGYSNRGNAIKRLMSYVVVIRPLVMRAVAKSETLALSMELKGFGANTYKNMPQQKLGLADYVVLLAVIALSTYPFWQEYVKI